MMGRIDIAIDVMEEAIPACLERWYCRTKPCQSVKHQYPKAKPCSSILARYASVLNSHIRWWPGSINVETAEMKVDWMKFVSFGFDMACTAGVPGLL